MLNIIARASAVSLIALLANAAVAQDTAPSDAEPAPEAAQTDAAEGLSLGAEVPDENTVGQSYTIATHGDWQVNCIHAPEGQQDPCNLYQLLKNEAGNDVAEISLFELPEGGQAAAGVTIITPLETLLTQQVTIQVDSSPAKRYPFSFCTQIGCFARIGLTTEEVNTFKRGAKATMTIVPVAAPDQKVNLDISLRGFTAGYEATAEANKPK